MTLQEIHRFENMAYERYQLMWMMTHGHTARELFKYVFCNHTESIDPDSGEFDLQDVLQLDPDGMFDEWEKNAGFCGELWACKDEFLQTEFLMPEYMNTLLNSDEYATYMKLVHERKA